MTPTSGGDAEKKESKLQGIMTSTHLCPGPAVRAGIPLVWFFPGDLESLSLTPLNAKLVLSSAQGWTNMDGPSTRLRTKKDELLDDHAETQQTRGGAREVKAKD